MRIVRQAVLEGQDARVLDDTVADLDRPPDGLVRVPARGTGEHRTQVRQERLADLPGGRVPQIRRAVINAVIADVIADGEHRLSEGCRARPAEAHTPVAGHIDDETAGYEGVQVGAGD